ncbi:MAG: ribosomal protein S18-alanine N-acetyltransferase [Ignisphaera sp.]
MNIRQANVENINEIYELEVMCFKDPYPKNLLFMLLTLYPELFLVAEINNKIVGYVSGILRRDGLGHIVSICIHPAYRRKGLGVKLMEFIEGIFREKFNVCKYRLEVRISNNPAINLYQKLGYRIVGIIPRYYTDGEDAYLMIKDSC